ncbi:MAG TPA: toll/interleukin-1 receptor domain-containing protein, partial [Thermoanaerobaculia bacterium]
GVLTRRPLAPAVREETTPSSSEKGPSSRKREKPVTKKHVFLSYVRETSDDVQRLRDDLIASGETVWWDADIPPGANWKLAIRQALKDAYAFVLCLSQEMAGRDVSGAFPEIRDAIAVYRELAPGRIFIVPVRLSECEVPTFEIDSTTTLEDLQLVNLFPEAERPDALSRLVAALRACPGHP